MTDSCQKCRGIDLSYYHTNTGNLPTKINLGTLKDLQTRPNCPVCGLVLGLLYSIGDGTLFSPPDHFTPQRLWERLSFFRSTSSPKDTENIASMQILLHPWDLGIEVHAEPQAQPDGLVPPRLLGELTVHSSDHPLLHSSDSGGRHVSGSLLRKLLNNCEATHADTCTGMDHHPKDRGILRILVIDVEKQCLVHMDSVLACRYVALSYVWGTVNILKAYLCNISALLQQDSLSTLKDQLPRVVLDAMSVVTILGERYLWVDALCIVQDDPISKPQQISQMDLIYSYSTITIVAADGKDANQGLPGLQINRRFPTAIRLQGVVLTRPAKDFRDLMNDTVYERRAWTLQEKVLSRRCLFFTSEQVFFRCNAGIHPENDPEPLVKMTLSASVRRTNSVNPFSKFISAAKSQYQPEPQSQKLLWHESILHYSFIMSDYTNRQLSFPSDILLAFEGLGATITSAMGGRLFCGLPEELFDQSLLWFRSPEATLKRRISPVQLSDGSTIVAPSWSWAGWEGHVRNLVAATSLSVNDYHGYQKPINIFEIHAPNGISHTKPPYKNSTHPLNEGNKPHEPFFPGNFVNGMPFQTHVLAFTGLSVSRASFEIEQVAKDQLTKIPWRSWILDKAGHRCGVLFDDLPSAVTTKVQQGAKFDLIAISLCLFSERLNSLGWGALPAREKGATMIDGSVYPLDPKVLADGLPPSGTCVLLIEWKHGNGACWAERLALGVMHLQAWDAMEPYSQVVTLA